MHGGTVRATSEGEGHGCTFTMELPLFHKSGLIAALGGVESIPESADELDGMAGEGGDGGGGLRVSPPDLESGGGHPSQQLLASPAPAHNSLWGRIFRGRVSLTGAGQFLNQKVRFTMVYKPENAAASEEEALGESPNRNHYCINDLDEVQHAGSGAVGSDDEEEADNEEAAVHTYSSQKMVLDGFGSEKRKSAKIAGRAVSKAKIVPICEDSRGDSSATMMLACNTASVRRSVLNDENEDELVDLENQATVDTPTIASNTSSSLFVSPRSSVATSASTAATNYSKCADNGTMNSIHNSNNIDTTKKKSWSSKLRFLAVDDAALNRKMMARLLVAAGHTVDEAGDGLECLAAMNLTAESTTKGDSINAKYDCVLMDENMPNLSGPEAAQKLRQAGYKGLIIGVTGDCYQDQMDHYVHMGANAVLPKPLKLDHLRAKLEELW